MNKKFIRKFCIIITVVLLCVSGASYFSFRYFYNFGHISSIKSAAFALLQWIKLSGLVMIPCTVFLKTKRFNFALKFILLPASLISLFFIRFYMSVEKTAANIQQSTYPRLVNFMPDNLVLVLFIVEAVLMAALAILCQFATSTRAISNKYTRKKSILAFLLVMLSVLPLSLLDNLVRLMPIDSTAYKFFYFKNYSLFHFVSIFGVFAATFLAYRLLKNKDKERRYRYLSTLAIAMMVQYFSKASMLVGDGYNVYYTILMFAPLYICNLGIPVVAIAIWTRNRVLNDICFFVHSAGALTVFFYYGKPELSNFGTIFNYSFLYFTLTHALLYVLCVLPVALGDYKLTVKRTILPMAYYAVVILVAAVCSEAITSITTSRYGQALAIYPNYAFTQVSPVPISFLSWRLRVLGMEFNMFYLMVLFGCYVGLFTVHYILYRVFDSLRNRRKGVLAKDEQMPKAA